MSDYICKRLETEKVMPLYRTENLSFFFSAAKMFQGSFPHNVTTSIGCYIVWGFFLKLSYLYRYQPKEIQYWLDYTTYNTGCQTYFNLN